jgi:hypothetical protein
LQDGRDDYYLESMRRLLKKSDFVKLLSATGENQETDSLCWFLMGLFVERGIAKRRDWP